MVKRCCVELTVLYIILSSLNLFQIDKMRAKPSSSSRSNKQSRSTSKSHVGHSKGVANKKNKESEKKVVPDLSVLRQPVETSVCGLKQAVKVYETGTPEVSITCLIRFHHYDYTIVS